jgi:hypothetical protein
VNTGAKFPAGGFCKLWVFDFDNCHPISILHELDEIDVAYGYADVYIRQQFLHRSCRRSRGQMAHLNSGKVREKSDVGDSRSISKFDPSTSDLTSPLLSML